LAPAQSEMFYYDASDSTIRTSNETSLCLAAYGGDLEDNDQIGLWTCGPADNFKWTVDGDGTIRSRTKTSMCISVVGGSVSRSALVLFTCSSPPSANEVWVSSFPVSSMPPMLPPATPA